MKRIVAVAAVLAGLIVASPAVAATWVVDAANPEVECQNADSPTIEGAVALAAPGDTVIVCPGSYAETVGVDKPLTLNGAGPDPHIRSADPTQEAVVDPDAALGFVLAAPEILLEGFTIRAASIGVRTERFASGYVIRKNLFTSNTTGLQLASDGTEPTVVRENSFRANRRFAIFNNVPSGALLNTRIEVNEFDNDESAISLSGQVVDVEIENNGFFGHRLSGVLVNGARIEIAHNAFESVTQPIRVVGFQANRVAYNDVRRGRLTGIAFFGGLSGFVEHNHVVQATADGIGLQNYIRGIVRGNHVEANGRHGVHLFNTTRNSFIEVNKSVANGFDGIRVDETSALNRINNNLSDANGEHDCHDETVGPLTGGTRNFWEHNLGDTANRPEICKPTGQPGGEPALLPPPIATAVIDAPPCMSFSQARETEVDSSAWNEAPWVCDPTSEELGPAPEER
jgi:hypothetical protein